MGLVGLAGPVWWAARPARRTIPRGLPLLGLGAVVSVAVVALANQAHWLVWFGAPRIGVFAVAGNAVSMVAVMRAVPPKLAGRAAAVASAGFFGGFAVGPPLTGLVVHQAGYAWLWVTVGVAFGVAAGIAFLVTRRTAVTV